MLKPGILDLGTMFLVLYLLLPGMEDVDRVYVAEGGRLSNRGVVGVQVTLLSCNL